LAGLLIGGGEKSQILRDSQRHLWKKRQILLEIKQGYVDMHNAHEEIPAPLFCNQEL